VATAAVAWRWRLAGASLLILEGLVIAVGYPLLFGSRFPIATVVMVLMTMAAPLLAAGILLIADGGRPPARA
jgi:hypothetical protein